MTTPATPSSTLEPYQAALEGWTRGPDDWPNTVSITAATEWTEESAAQPTAQDTASDYADQHGDLQLVLVDTNYKETRSGEHPVRLTRLAALELATHVILATEDTFHYSRVGRLRATQAAELLHAVDTLQQALQNLREHALQDLLHDTGIDE